MDAKIITKNASELRNLLKQLEFLCYCPAHTMYTPIYSILFYSNLLCGSIKYPYLPHGRSLEIPRGKGVWTAKIYKGKYEAYLEIPGGREGSNQNTFRGGGIWIFFGTTHSSLNESYSILFPFHSILFYMYSTDYSNSILF